MEARSGFKAIQEPLSLSLVRTTKTVSQVAEEDLDFHRSCEPSIGSRLDKQTVRLLGFAKEILGSSAENCAVVRPQLDDAEDVELNWAEIVDVLDTLLERADSALDEFSGIVKRPSPSQEQASTPKPKKRGFNLLGTQNLPKSQLLFDDVPHNNFTGPFVPLLTSKPNAIEPFEESVRLVHVDDSIFYPHPYHAEIAQYQYPHSVYERSEPIPYQPFETTEAVYVDTLEALEEMLEELKSASEIAIDLEHHDNRSYVGIVSLMQISTRTKDWIVDTLKPWRRKLQVLNEVFTDPKILKVLHGSYMDSVWLQRDFGLYLVGTFDTYHAATALGYSGRGLAFLLKRFIDFDAQKQYQTADWRIRPLPDELFDYARSDTHFLLYIYDCMRNELIHTSPFRDPGKSKIQYVLHHSKLYNLERYENPQYDEEYGDGSGGWYKPLSRTPSLFSKEQFSIFRAVHQWRDKLARELDESTGYIMTNSCLFKVAQSVPKDEPSLFSAVQPMSPPIRTRKSELLALIAKANFNGQYGPEMAEVLDMGRLRRGEPPSVQAPSSSFAPTLTPSSSKVSGFNTHTLSSEDSRILRARTSQFWGAIVIPDPRNQQRSITSESTHLAVPLPRLTAQIFEDTTTDSTPNPALLDTPKDLNTRTELLYRTAEQRRPVAETNEVFTIKQLGQKRKRDSDLIADERYLSSPSGVETQFDSNVVPDKDVELGEKRSKKAERRKRQREAKKRASQDAFDLKEEDRSHDANEAVRDLEAPFDYENAPSVLRAQIEGKGERGKRAGFNPYAKATDAPKGLGRAQKERAGRSGTFNK